VRPHDNIVFRAITIEDAYTAALRTDALVAAVQNIACGKQNEAAAASYLDELEVKMPAWVASVRHIRAS
jgi:hypothetical protein